MTLDPACIFCKIIEGDIPAEIVYRNENVLAFNDLNPQAPTHVLIIPTLHAKNAAEISTISPTIIAAMHRAADEIARSLTLAQMLDSQFFTLTFISWVGVDWHGPQARTRFLRIWNAL
jgi:diadenosine tetraphosphate (Ap4A) HIT family hydrolase